MVDVLPKIDHNPARKTQTKDCRLRHMSRGGIGGWQLRRG
jgi:hypothetical protein